MKTSKLIMLYCLLSFVGVACSSDDDAPAPVNEEEVITTMTITLIPSGGGTTVTLQTQDLDGDGPNPPDVTVSGDLMTQTIYNGSIDLLNETVNPNEDVALEVLAEATEHQFFFDAQVVTSSISTMYTDMDVNGNPIGLSFTLRTNGATAGTLGVTLRHDLDKFAPGVAQGDIANAGGDTDIAATFDINISQ